MDLTVHTESLISQVAALPPELADILIRGTNAQYLDAVAAASLDARYTDAILIHLKPIFPELCARWNASSRPYHALNAYGRILPFAPYLAEYAELFLERLHSSHALLPAEGSSDSTLEEALLGYFRLLLFDRSGFSKFIDAQKIHSYVFNTNRVLRYLTIRVLCLHVNAADAAYQQMLQEHLGERGTVMEIMGSWEGKQIDFRFFGLYEEQRLKDIQKRLSERQRMHTPADLQHTQVRRVFRADDFSPATVEVAGVLLPRAAEAHHWAGSSLVTTITTRLNLAKLCQGLLDEGPVLLTGLAGAGKTSLVMHLARVLNKSPKMITLHLNEQSDAKTLIGMYTTGATPGSFSWRPGVLTTAVREGRWVLIEDLDRAPNEVLSTLLPLIERGELLIPGRGETVHAHRGFKILATMRTTITLQGVESTNLQGMLGARFWQSVHVESLPMNELEEIVRQLYPQLGALTPQVMATYARVLQLSRTTAYISRSRSGIARAITTRDLLKWCARIEKLLQAPEELSDNDLDNVFLEAKDCFAGSLPDNEVKDAVVSCIAEELHVDPQRKRYLLTDRPVKYALMGKSANSSLRVGRASLQRSPEGLRQGFARPTESAHFSVNGHMARVLEQVAVAIDRKEPLLLVGETGIGKTTAIQHLADKMNHKLVAFNLSQQSESGDLLGGFKPVNIRSMVMPMIDEFNELFGTTFSLKRNKKFLEMLSRYTAKGEWKRVSMLWKEAMRMVKDHYDKALASRSPTPVADGEQASKRRKIDTAAADPIKARWDKFASDLHILQAQVAGKSSFAFSFVEGNIVKAVRNGDWVLLDEINLAAPDTLEALADLLESGPDAVPSVLLTEAGSPERIIAHPNFRLFAAMNPATDAGKRDLPMGIRSRFTEIYVESPDRDPQSLLSIVQGYLGGANAVDATAASDVRDLYLAIQNLVDRNMLVDGANQKPHYSLRTLTRTLQFANQLNGLCSLRRALYEGFSMSFMTFLDKASEEVVSPLLAQHIFRKPALKNVPDLKRPLVKPADDRQYVQEGQYWLRQGRSPVEQQQHYIITPFVRRNLDNLIRAASTRRYPVLLQGPTSAGKTSMIEYLAKRSGNKFVRINNHEHTDLQEYLGTYVSGEDGQLRFQEGVLVRALREGHWIVLDELNLAPTDVLEALNRLLDDNRELLIPETQEVVRPHQDFMLFATQNPAGLYGGRKVLSRAFRNRFLELHFDDIPVDELTEILQRRCQVPESWCKKIVDVYRELSILRQENRLFEQKSFATLRDLFRWALRRADTIEQLARDGYLLLAERVRKADEREAVKATIEKVLSRRGPKVVIDIEQLYAREASPEMQRYDQVVGSGEVVWTRAMRRLFVLVSHAMRNQEPVLLVGDTGCGKTTVCQMLAAAFGKQLFTVNAHQNTETGDLIGAQRPIRNRASLEHQLQEQLKTIFKSLGLDGDGDEDLDASFVQYDALDQDARSRIPSQLQEAVSALRARRLALFEWADGSLVHAMKEGHFFLLDEISLADDSVLERLNSVLEPERTILLAEKGSVDSVVTAAEGFQFFATMNPGGDYGKKELSPALRNRFTEVWVPSLTDMEDMLQIVKAKLAPGLDKYAEAMITFAQWFGVRYNRNIGPSISIRDLLGWVQFTNCRSTAEDVQNVAHGAAMVFIDTLGAAPAGMIAMSGSVSTERHACHAELGRLLKTDTSAVDNSDLAVQFEQGQFRIGPFSIPREGADVVETSFSFVPTTKLNTMRLVRALQLTKPVLLEGNPGVGKTTLVGALARCTGKRLERINLSEQTDLMDLFGSDVPVEGAGAGHFAWRDAPFLKAMKNGDWVLLDEMNLASQSVLEGLNACLDHRGEVYVSELDQTFQRHPDFRLFAAQNPHHQGGGRKGLPASFVNRFTVVYADVFSAHDLALICRQSFPSLTEQTLEPLIRFVDKLDQEVVHQRKFASLGSPWEFNLRDTLRWLHLINATSGMLSSGSARDYFDTVFSHRFRSDADRQKALQLFFDIVGSTFEPRSFYENVASAAYQVGLGLIERSSVLLHSSNPSIDMNKGRLPILESLIICVQMSWPVILVGPSGSGKTHMIEKLAAMVGADLVTFSMNSDIDAMDIVGGYEQSDPTREVQSFLQKLDRTARSSYVQSLYQDRTLQSSSSDLSQLSSLIHAVRAGDASLADLCQVLAELHEQGNLPESARWLALCQKLASTSGNVSRAQFEWLDGLLVRALEQGKWLVLDNANLCSSSVLDRLNSLLESNGFLSISEHSTENGDARIVRPHPDFRIFLTMDPKYGELSRAMRNRAIELYLLPLEISQDKVTPRCLSPVSLDSSLFHVRQTLSVLPRVDGDIPDAGVQEFSTERLSLVNYDAMSRSSDDAIRNLLSLPQFMSVQDDKRSQLVAARDEKIKQHYGGVCDGIMPGKGLESAQSIQTLYNQPLVLHGSVGLQRAFQCSFAYDAINDIIRMHDAIEAATTSFNNDRQMTRFQRSVHAASIRGAQKDTTFKVAPFLYNTIGMLTRWVTISSVSENIMTMCWLQSVCHFWWDMLRHVHSRDFDEATFQVLMSRGTDLLNGKSHDVQEVDNQLLALFKKELDTFQLSSNRKTGLNMEVLWEEFHPTTLPSYDRLQVYLQLEALTGRFDRLIWRVPAPLQERVKMRQQLATALTSVRFEGAEAGSLVHSIENTIDEQETSIESEDASPYFKDQFEGVYQYYSLPSDDDHDNLAGELMQWCSFLGGRSTRSALVSNIPRSQGGLLLRMSDYVGELGNSTSLMALQGIFATSMLGKISEVGSVIVKDLSLLKTEMEILGQSVATSVPFLCRDQLSLLDFVLESLIKQVISACESTGDVHVSTKQVLERYLYPVKEQYFGTRDVHGVQISDDAAGAWISFSLGCLLLYIPDRQFDPALRPHIERVLFRQRQQTLERKISALQQIEHALTGQTTNLRIRLFQQELEEMGSEPPVPAIARPPKSELGQLQGEFANLLSILDRMSSDKPSTDVVLQNVVQLIDRLSNGYRAYEDITAPAVGFLHCLVIGLKLNSISRAGEHPEATVRRYLKGNMLLAGRVPSAWASDLSEAAVEPDLNIELRLYSLKLLAISNQLEGSLERVSGIRAYMHFSFANFYQQWREKLTEDQAKEAAKSSMYRYRGGQTDEEEQDDAEYQDLFPEYDEVEHAGPKDSDLSSQQLAVSLAKIQEALLRPGGEPLDKMISHIRHSSRLLGQSEGTRPTLPRQHDTTDLLPTILLQLDDERSKLLNEAPVKNLYNIYTDSNLAEVRKLSLLIEENIQPRFQQLHRIWPEHATIGDVLTICNELFAFRHTEPIAKFMTKTEKLHEALHEWQQVASKEYSAAQAYDEVTNLLVSWRQLELTTWSRLLDLEIEKCNDDAKAWWFIAFENIMAVPESIAEESILDHAQQLLKTLEGFMASTAVGQYKQRLNLLSNMTEHLRLRSLDVPRLEVVHNAMSNFLAYYGRYESLVEEHLRKGRQTLERDVKNVLQVASWKDRNIDALRQSAKSSHKKLFKLVRKFRALLGQPVEPLLRQEPRVAAAVEMKAIGLQIPVAHIDTELVASCDERIPAWSARPARFKKLPATLQLMVRKGQLGDSALDGPQYLESFMDNLQSSMETLRKATPSVLMEDNKHQVTQLKVQKRKLFADTLRELRTMGFKSNLGIDVLAKQNDASKILASIPTIKGLEETSSMANAEGHLFKLLDHMGKVRESAREHSADLTSAEVARSIGYLESSLQLALHQRKDIVRSVQQIQQSRGIFGQLEAICSPQPYQLQPQTDSNSPRRGGLLAILPSILKVAARILTAHARLGNLDSSAPIEGLYSHSSNLQSILDSSSALPKMPEGLSTSVAERVVSEQAMALEKLEEDIHQWVRAEPLTEVVLRQIKPYLYGIGKGLDGRVNGNTNSTLEDLGQQVATAADLILGSIQDLETSLQSLPSSAEDPNWLHNVSQSLSASVLSLHTGHINASLQGILNTLQHVQSSSGDGLELANLLLTTMAPLFKQYRIIQDTTIARFAQLHKSTCSMSYRLAKAFLQIATQGFCTPSEKSDENAGKNDKLEEGTGLGEGEGAEDISKDIQDDEDLSELAQTKNEQGDKEDMEDEKEAVDMQGEELEGEMSDAAPAEDDENGDAASDKGDEADEMEEEAGDVNDLGPSTVDEKMWDDGGKDADKEKEGQDSKGTQKEDEQIAGEEGKGTMEETQEQDEMGEEMPEDEQESVRKEMEQTDPHVQEGENLELPEELDMDGDKSQKDDMSDIDDLGELEDGLDEEEKGEGDQDMEEQLDATEPMEEVPDEGDEEVNMGEQTEDPVDLDKQDEEKEDNEASEAQQESNHDGQPDAADDVAEGGVNPNATAEDQQMKDQDASTEAAAQAEDGQAGATKSTDTNQSEAESGQLGLATNNDAGNRGEDMQDEQLEQFKKLGDALEQWYKRQREISKASGQDNAAPQQQDVDMADADFEHLENEEDRADAQALGKAAKEQARALDESMGLDANEQDVQEDKDDFLPDEVQDQDRQQRDEDTEMADAPTTDKPEQTEKEAGRPNAFIGERNERDPLTLQDGPTAGQDTEDDISHVDDQLFTVHLDSDLPTTSPRTLEEARSLWTHHTTLTQPLSLTLTEQLRLILAPTLATKMRGDFRTGKRLNIKRIIPYIASQYKRDKIWMRRSVPSKRAYQIMLAIDDSKSMRESGSGELALQTLALVSRALSMLEVGEMSVVGFGEESWVAHEFGKPFTQESGVEVFRQFGFGQEKTDVKKLVSKSLGIFQEARVKSLLGAGGQQLWQLQLIISDGLCEDHETIRRMVRQAQEERIMVVFIVVDAVKGQSVTQLETAEFSDGKLSRKRYMDTFPFGYYLVVREVSELPHVLAAALRQWFAEVAETG